MSHFVFFVKRKQHTRVLDIKQVSTNTVWFIRLINAFTLVSSCTLLPMTTIGKSWGSTSNLTSSSSRHIATFKGTPPSTSAPRKKRVSYYVLRFSSLFSHPGFIKKPPCTFSCGFMQHQYFTCSNETAHEISYTSSAALAPRKNPEPREPPWNLSWPAVSQIWRRRKARC